jgi:hypothetical protein
MTSFRQLQANRRNARNSTGPITTEGKQRSRCNAVRHGLTAEVTAKRYELVGAPMSASGRKTGGYRAHIWRPTIAICAGNSMIAHEHPRSIIDTRPILARPDSRTSFTASGAVGILASEH